MVQGLISFQSGNSATAHHRWSLHLLTHEGAHAGDEHQRMADIAGLTDLPRLLTVLAAQSRGLLNMAELSHVIGIARRAIKRYLTLLGTVQDRLSPSRSIIMNYGEGCLCSRVDSNPCPAGLTRFDGPGCSRGILCPDHDAYRRSQMALCRRRRCDGEFRRRCGEVELTVDWERS